MRPMRLVMVLALALAAAAGVQVALAGSGDSQRPTGSPSAAEVRLLQGVNFIVSCDFSHRNADDVIIFPGLDLAVAFAASSLRRGPRRMLVAVDLNLGRKDRTLLRAIRRRVAALLLQLPGRIGDRPRVPQFDGFDVVLIPHTLKETTLGERRPGDPVNLEADVLGKYVKRHLERMLGSRSGAGETS